MNINHNHFTVFPILYAVFNLFCYVNWGIILLFLHSFGIATLTVFSHVVSFSTMTINRSHTQHIRGAMPTPEQQQEHVGANPAMPEPPSNWPPITPLIPPLSGSNEQQEVTGMVFS